MFLRLMSKVLSPCRAACPPGCWPTPPSTWSWAARAVTTSSTGHLAPSIPSSLDFSVEMDHYVNTVCRGKDRDRGPRTAAQKETLEPGGRRRHGSKEDRLKSPLKVGQGRLRD